MYFYSVFFFNFTHTWRYTVCGMTVLQCSGKPRKIGTISLAVIHSHIFGRIKWLPGFPQTFNKVSSSSHDILCWSVRALQLWTGGDWRYKTINRYPGPGLGTFNRNINISQVNTFVWSSSVYCGLSTFTSCLHTLTTSIFRLLFHSPVNP